jgi:hypothetical protein
MDGCKIDEEQSPRHTFEGPLHPLGLAHEPHEHIVLEIGCLMRYQTQVTYNGLTNRLIIPVIPILLHLRKSFFNHRSDVFNFLLNLGREVG